MLLNICHHSQRSEKGGGRRKCGVGFREASKSNISGTWFSIEGFRKSERSGFGEGSGKLSGIGVVLKAARLASEGVNGGRNHPANKALNLTHLRGVCLVHSLRSLLHKPAPAPAGRLALSLYFTGGAMKICAVSPFVEATEKEILAFISACKSDLIVLPGNGPNHPSHKRVSKVLKRGAFAFVETGEGKRKSIPWLVSSSKYIEMPPQVFSQNPTASELDQLQDVWPNRTHKIKGRKCSFAICGEVDGFEKNGSAKKGRSLPYEILINPTHTTRGRWNHLGVKLENLSRGTVVVHVANNDYNNHNVTTHLRIYVDGKVMPRENSGNISWSECEI